MADEPESTDSKNPDSTSLKVLGSKHTTAAKPSITDIFHSEESALLRFAYGFLGRRELAEDIVQDAFLKLHHCWEDVQSPRPWLYRCVRNLSLNYLRDHKRETLTDDPAMDTHTDSTTPDDEMKKQEIIGLMRMHLSELKPEDRELIRLKYTEDLKYAQIGERTGQTVSNVGYRLHHLLKSLATSLRKDGVNTSKT